MLQLPSLGRQASPIAGLGGQVEKCVEVIDAEEAVIGGFRRWSTRHGATGDALLHEFASIVTHILLGVARRAAPLVLDIARTGEDAWWSYSAS